jgi:hypothetical protein
MTGQQVALQTRGPAVPKEVTDRLATLEVLFKSCGGAGWKKKGGWVTDAGLLTSGRASGLMQRAG